LPDDNECDMFVLQGNRAFQGRMPYPQDKGQDEDIKNRYSEGSTAAAAAAAATAAAVQRSDKDKVIYAGNSHARLIRR